MRCAALGCRRAAVNGPPIRHRRDACGVAPRLRGCQAAMGASCFASAAALDRRGVGIATWPRCDVLQAPLRFRGDRRGSVAANSSLCSQASNVDAPAATLRFSRFRLKLDQRTRHGPHRCAVQSKVARAVARPQLPHALLQALALLSAAGPAGKSDALRHRDIAADTACRCCKRGRCVQSLAPSPPRRRRALLGNDGGWRRGDVASSPRVVRRSRGASLRHARGRGLATGARPSAGASRRGLRDGVEPSKRRRRLDLRAVVLRGSDET